MNCTLPTTLLTKPGVQHGHWGQRILWHPREEEKESRTLGPDVYFYHAAGTTNYETIVDWLNTSERDANSVLVYVLGAGERTDWAENYTVPCGLENAFFIVVSSGHQVHETLDPLPKGISDKLASLARLPENWDGAGASSISPNTVQRAKAILLEAFSVGKGRIPLPSIAPTSQGMIVCEWSMPNGTELILDVPPGDESPVFLLVEVDQEGAEIETEAQLGEEWPIESLISRLLGD